MIIEELIAVLGYDVRGEQNLAKFEKGLGRVHKGLSTLQSFVAGFAGGLAAELSMAFGRGMEELITGPIKVGATFEKLQATLETIDGSAEKARASLDWVTKFAKQTPFDLEQVSEAFVRLKANGLDPMDGTLLALGDTASAMGKPLMSAVEAMADAVRGESERLKEFGIVAKKSGETITYSWDQNGKALSKTVKATSTEIRAALIEILGQRFSGAMVRQAKTFDGLVANVGDSWLLLKKRIADAGIFDYTKEQIAGLLDWLDELDRDGTLNRWARRVSDAMIGASRSFMRWGRAVRDIGVFVARQINRIGEAVGARFDLDGWQGLMLVLGGLLAVVSPTAAAFAFIILAIDDFLTYLEGGESYFGDFVKALQDTTGLGKGWSEALVGAAALIAPALILGLGGALSKVLAFILTGWPKALGGAFKIAFKLGAKNAAIASTVEAAVTEAAGAGTEAAARPKKDTMGLRPRAASAGIWSVLLGLGVPSDREELQAFIKENGERSQRWNDQLRAMLPDFLFPDKPFLDQIFGGSEGAKVDPTADVERVTAKLRDLQAALAALPPARFDVDPLAGQRTAIEGQIAQTEAALANVKAKAEGQSEELKGEFSGINLLAVGVKIIMSLKDGMSAQWGAVIEWARGAARELASALTVAVPAPSAPAAPRTGRPNPMPDLAPKGPDVSSLLDPRRYLAGLRPAAGSNSTTTVQVDAPVTVTMNGASATPDAVAAAAGRGVKSAADRTNFIVANEPSAA